MEDHSFSNLTSEVQLLSSQSLGGGGNDVVRMRGQRWEWSMLQSLELKMYYIAGSRIGNNVNSDATVDDT